MTSVITTYNKIYNCIFVASTNAPCSAWTKRVGDDKESAWCQVTKQHVRCRQKTKEQDRAAACWSSQGVLLEALLTTFTNQHPLACACPKYKALKWSIPELCSL